MYVCMYVCMYVYMYIYNYNPKSTNLPEILGVRTVILNYVYTDH
jgi:hypothetical protein